MKKQYTLLLLMALLWQGVATAQSSCYELVWSDEFAQDGAPDANKWSYEVGNNGWGNSELQYYTNNRRKNARVHNGKLIIEAHKEDYKGAAYTSARMITHPNGHSWQYGRIEASMKLPYGQGIWPAFWMLGDGVFGSKGWPACGEIDIMEMVGGAGRDNTTHGTLHWADLNGNHAMYGTHNTLSRGIMADTFHVFAIEWTPDYIKWFFDGAEFHRVDITPNHMDEFRGSFFIILNLAVGGQWPGYPDATTVLPQSMEVDYVRVYQKNNTPEITGATTVFAAQKNIRYSVPGLADGYSYEWTVPTGAQLVAGQGTPQVLVHWGCTEGAVACKLTTPCTEHTLSLAINLKNKTIDGPLTVPANQTGVPFSVPQTRNANYTWLLPSGIATSAADTSYISVDWNGADGTVTLQMTDLCGSHTLNHPVMVVRQLPFPNPNQPHRIPGTIWATNYDMGGEGLAYHDSDNSNVGTGPRQNEAVDTEYHSGGENIGWVQPGEWLEYTVAVDSSGLYDLAFTTASSNGGGTFKLLFNGREVKAITTQANGSWTNYVSLLVKGLQLYRTDTLMRVQIVQGELNIGQLVFAPAATQTTSATTHRAAAVQAYPNPCGNNLQITGLQGACRFGLMNAQGQWLVQGTLQQGGAIDLGQLPAGLYWLRIKQEDGKPDIVQKILKAPYTP